MGRYNGMFFTGGSHDGYDMERANGMYVSEDGETWSNQPITDEQKAEKKANDLEKRIWYEIMDHISGKRTLRDEYFLAKQRKSGLSSRCRRLLISVFEVKEGEPTVVIYKDDGSEIKSWLTDDEWCVIELPSGLTRMVKVTDLDFQSQQ